MKMQERRVEPAEYSPLMKYLTTFYFFAACAGKQNRLIKYKEGEGGTEAL